MAEMPSDLPAPVLVDSIRVDAAWDETAAVVSTVP